MGEGQAGPPATSLRQGVPPLLGYAVLTAAMDVYAGNRFSVVSPAGLAAVSFTLTFLFFGAAELRRGGTRRISALAEHRVDLVAINITTTVTWLSTFYALKYLEPAIVNVIGLALGPVITTLAGPLMRRQSSVIPAETAVAVLICGLLAMLLWGSFSGDSGLGHITALHATLGLVFTLTCAAGSAVNILYMKRLSEAGCDSGTVLATRFVLMAAVSWGLVAVGDRGGLHAALVPGAVVAVIGVGVPIYVLQVGIRHTEPITTSLLVALSPLFAFVMQLADGRLSFSALTLVGVLGVVALVCLGVLARARRSAAEAGAGSQDTVSATDAGGQQNVPSEQH
ncbi:DMT family transporter [Actinacidiphila yeochonensis]|uniref:DMT family transporter n=1 Tax=Actinacidiphila yeochonensis TaxID=89050 RepID=UPI000ADF522B|nr:DMT family transporter [Actinacidiphila yeochonensis]